MLEKMRAWEIVKVRNYYQRQIDSKYLLERDCILEYDWLELLPIFLEVYTSQYSQSIFQNHFYYLLCQ